MMVIRVCTITYAAGRDEHHLRLSGNEIDQICANTEQKGLQGE